MRTSKKAGRGGSWGGIEPGQSGTPALAAPMTRYQSASTSRRSVKGQVLRGVGWFLLVVLVIGAGVGGGVYLYANETIGALNGDTNKANHKAQTLLSTIPRPGAPAVALIAGYDVRAASGNNAYAGSNSDTLMLLRADPRTDTLSLLSFPRDLNVPIYCTGNTILTSDRINSAWAHCGANGGPTAALDTMEHLTGEKFKINYLITLDFHAFKEIVNRIHGVYINVDRRYYIAPHTGTSTINLHPGYQKLNGGEALSFVRFRHLDSDIYRNGRQQLFMEALKQRLKQTLTLSNVFEIPKIIGAVKGNLAIEKGDGSAVSWGEMKTYLGLLLGLPAGHLIRNAIPPQDLTNFVTSGGADELQASPGAVAAAVDRFLHPHVPKHHAHSGHGKTPKMPHSQISVLVLNGGTINGEAVHTSRLLRDDGFVTKKLPKSTPANTSSHMHDTVVYYDPSQANAQKAAEVLAPLFGSHSVLPMTSAIASFAHQAGNPLTVVAIGTAYKGRLKLPHTGGGQGGSTAGAQVQPGIGITYTAVRSEDKPAHFPLFVPHTLALGSSLSTDEGVRLFGPTRGRQELVLTFNLNNGIEYWQIEESDWLNAPLFQTPTKHFLYQGRTFKEWTSGGQIQRIAVFVGHSVYWVQNTILNSLSNSTMTAIAEGLQPLHRH
jgi:LCP family protein required for cell wall assembly